jgi:hypothetical protein
MNRLIIFCVAFLSAFANAVPSDHGVDYDIIYVRYPANNVDGGLYVNIPQGEKAYRIEGGADLMRLSPNGATEIIVECDNTCSIMDPYVSYDGTTVYYSKMLDIDQSTRDAHEDVAGYIYKVDVSGGAPYTEVQLTYPGTFDCSKHSGNVNADDDMSSFTNIRDMAPVPLSNGDLLFTSNRHCNIGFNLDPQIHRNPVQAMYLMSDHDGTANSPELSNMRRIDNSNMSMVQHPMQLKDGRILFSTWQDVAGKFTYAMTPLFTMYPDGSNLQQFTEPHDKNKNVEHFITQLANEAIVAGWYYPSFDFGFGGFLRYPIDPPGQDWLKESITQRHVGWSTSLISFRKFDRVGTEYITTHTTNKDTIAPNRSGKYSMPSAGKYGDMLVAYSQGYVNYFGSSCAPSSQFSSPFTQINNYSYPDNNCENLRSGIYLFKDAETAKVDDPTDSAQLAVMIDDPAHNEIWPRALVPYSAIYSVAAPAVIPSTRETANNVRLAKGEQAAIVGTSSMYNRESAVIGFSPDGATIPNTSRDQNPIANYRIQGTDVGVYTNNDIHAFRILAMPETPFTNTLSISGFQDYASLQVKSNPSFKTPRRFSSTHNESWEILGEFPLAHKAVTDLQGNPDTSWQAKIPANTPTTIQAIDINGMTLNSETVWRALSPGEERTDCGGCHVHSVEVSPLDFATTETGKGMPIQNITGVSNDDPRIQNSIVDLSTDSVPLLDAVGGVEWRTGGSVQIEYTTDIQPIIDANCMACHTATGDNGGLVLDTDPWVTLTNFDKSDSTYNGRRPQQSKYIRNPQARNSLFVWVAWDQRLDGRDNADRADDIDFPNAHPVVNLSDADKRTISRWVDIGAPINIPGIADDGFKYTDDNQLPIIDFYSPSRDSAPVNQRLRFGVTDAQTGVDWTTLAITYYDVASPGTVLTVSTFIRDDVGVVSAQMPSLTVGNDYVFKVTVDDNNGNTQIATSRFTALAAVDKPAQVENIQVQVQ